MRKILEQVKPMTNVISESSLVFTRSKQVIFRIKDTLKLGTEDLKFCEIQKFDRISKRSDDD